MWCHLFHYRGHKGQKDHYKAKFGVHILKFANYLHEKNETKNIRPLVFSFSPVDKCFLFCFIMWFARFQELLFATPTQEPKV